MRTKLFLESTQNQRCFNVEIYRRINVDKSTLNQRGYYVDQRRDVISTYINVESTLSVCWGIYYKKVWGIPTVDTQYMNECIFLKICLKIIKNIFFTIQITFRIPR